MKWKCQIAKDTTPDFDLEKFGFDSWSTTSSYNKFGIGGDGGYSCEDWTSQNQSLYFKKYLNNTSSSTSWLNNLTDDVTPTLTHSSNLGNRCKVEIISRSDLLRARGFKPVTD